MVQGSITGSGTALTWTATADAIVFRIRARARSACTVTAMKNGAIFYQSQGRRSGMYIGAMPVAHGDVVTVSFAGLAQDSQAIVNLFER